MRSRTVRITVGLLALIALGLAAGFVIRTQQQVTTLTASVRAFDLHARETTDALADLRVGQQAYVAAGQGVAFWMPKVATTATVVRNGILALRQSAASGPARAALMEAEAAVAEFDAVDKRAREYLKSGDHLMAADVIFTEGGDTAATAGRLVERARLSEHQALDARVAAVRSQQGLALGVAGGVVGLVVLLRREAARVVGVVDLAVAVVVAAVATLRRRQAVFAVVFGTRAARIVGEVDEPVAVVVDAVGALRRPVLARVVTAA